MIHPCVSPHALSQCLIDAGLSSQILFPGEAAYAKRNNSYWSKDAKLQPACIVRPKSATDVAKAVVALKKAGQKFAVRSGGHTNWAGSNNITNGVTIDLGLLNSIKVDLGRQTVSLGPAATWGLVYDELAKYELAVAGGREGKVGVGGLLLGGGISYYSGRCGFACNNVVGYEVLLADGRLVNVEASGDHADLFRVLKGGSNNFGIVTRFTMRTIPGGMIWGGVALLQPETTVAASHAIVKFTANIHKDPDSSLMYVLSHNSAFGDDVAIVAAVNVAAVENPTAYNHILQLPKMSSNFKIMQLKEILSYSPLAREFYNVWFTICFRNDASIVSSAYELHGKMLHQIKAQLGNNDFTSNCAFQPIPRVFTAPRMVASQNILGIERYPHDAILLHACVGVGSSEKADQVRPHVRALIEGVRDSARRIEDGILPWIHLNYADPSQSVLESYGTESLKEISRIASKYDPDQVFQHLCPGGFKIPLSKD